MENEKVPLWICFLTFLYSSVLTTAIWAIIKEATPTDQSTSIPTYRANAILCYKRFLTLWIDVKKNSEKQIKMVKATIRYRIPFDYLLVDSWFTNTGLVDFVYSCHKSFICLAWQKWVIQSIPPHGESFQPKPLDVSHT